MMILRFIAVIFLASAAMAEQPAFRMLPVPQVTLYPGDAITMAVLTAKKFRMPAGSETSYVISEGQIEGKFARRTLIAGRPIILSAIRGTESVKQGKAVIATYAEDGLVITGSLVPLQSAEAGQTIQARNAETGLVVQAEVQADGTLRINLP